MKLNKGKRAPKKRKRKSVPIAHAQLTPKQEHRLKWRHLFKNDPREAIRLLREIDKENFKAARAEKIRPLDSFDPAALRAMPYEDFLKSEYWQRVRIRKQLQAGKRCEKCGNTKGLQTHHLHYRSHGLEHLDLDCLKVLCDACHKKEHGL